MGADVVAVGNARTIDEVVDMMTAIDGALPRDDGVATFNRMYTQVTRLVRDAVDLGDFQAGEFLERLDVHFANLFFAAYAADAAREQVPRAWAPLFEARARPETHPIQFALAGMNAHISHDLPFAVVATCRELGVVPDEDTPEHLDYTQTNEVLAEASVEIKSWFSTGAVATLDELGGRVDDGFAMFGIHLARAAAWQCSQMVWMLNDNPRMDTYFRENLGRGVEMTSRGILL
ncbi:DUF5995 family protein [Nocardioides sp.]|uniref:DUF5995 family protein n=1 Tax=Nocardioides sp. TaxID=35761 RepID=UPI002B88CECC|nr:DUF5995 family protein [Nocardioides sp.]HXH80950.1 DUF5995 family protein [Nocardioides sp.]